MAKKAGIGSHHSQNALTHDWITPPEILESLGQFDLDPCQSLTQPWPCAEEGYTVEDDGLSRHWSGRVFCNPPYGQHATPFLERMAKHDNGVALIFARTETQMFFSNIWDSASAVLFLKGRLTFYRPDGTKAKGNSGGPSVLVAYGKENVEPLRRCGLPGSLVTRWEEMQNP